MKYLNTDYIEAIDTRTSTMAVQAGITGLWQVSGRASTTHDERMRLDRWYARNWSFWLDIYILFKTVGAVLVRTGSR